MDDNSKNRVARWTQKLLDLSLRNRLLNARDSKQILPLAVDDVASLEDRLSADQAVAVEPSDSQSRSAGALRSTLASDDMLRRLKEIFRLAKTDLEESGVNALYLALGFLRWRPKGANAKECRAPILLMPVQMTRKNVREGYTVSRLDDDFGISVSGLDPLPEDDSGVDVAKVFATFREAVKSMEGWDVEEAAAIGNFSFGKFVMWKDLTARADQLGSHPFVSHLMKGGGDYDDGIEVFPPEEIASHIKYGELFTPLSADMGKSFVLHGPPGTGKSQTITNLIAHNLALGRRVLFVSEKKAALDVVHRRLSSVGLKPFCLELHSNKSGKTEVLAQFKEALDYVDKGTPNEWQKTVDQISNYRSALDAPIAALHRRYPNGLSAYDCFAMKIAGGAKTFPIVGGKVCEWSEKDVSDIRELVLRAAADWRGTTADAVKALVPVATFAWNPGAEEDMRGKLAALRAKGSFARGMSVLFGGGGALRYGPGLVGRFEGFGGAFAAKLDAAIAAMGESRGVMRYRESAGPESAGESFDRSVGSATLVEILRTESALASFAGLKREEQIIEFRRLDAEYAELVKHAVRAKLAALLPSGRLGDCPDGCELGIVRRECAKKSRQKPIRRLLAEARGIIGRIKPCFLMSPLSVAQYLVVFDEASQIPVWDAIGVIARAKQCVVVGDPKQMPPTNFFQKGETGDDEDESEDLESILDECLAAGLSSAYLSWHYRSRHESLIAFSNHHYYGDRLCTFPAAKTTPRLGVAWHFVENGVRRSLAKAPQRWRRHFLDGAEKPYRRHLRRTPRGKPEVRGLLCGRRRGAVLREEPRERAGRRARRHTLLRRLCEGPGRQVPHELRPTQPLRRRASPQRRRNAREGTGRRVRVVQGRGD